MRIEDKLRIDMNSLPMDDIVEIIHHYSGIPQEVSANIAAYICNGRKPELSIWRSVFLVGAQRKGYSEEKAAQIWEWLNTHKQQ